MSTSEFVQSVILHWKTAVFGGVAGAVTLILLSETLRWWLGKGFFQ